MNVRKLLYPGFCVAVANGWDDITATLEEADPPITIADPVSGVGALQLSPAIYESGRLPGITPESLSEMLEEFASSEGFDEPFDRIGCTGEVAMEGASFRAGEDFIRVWYVSDGTNVILITYVCEWEQREVEASEREMIVHSIRFEGS